MSRLAVRLLGGFQVELDGEAVYAFKTDKARALLAYLVVESAHPHRRETLAALLWPDRPDSAARANLRQALSYVRQALRDDSQSPDPQSHDSQSHGPSPFLLVTPTDVQFNTASDHTLDVAQLEAFAAGPAHGEHGRAAGTTAVAAATAPARALLRGLPGRDVGVRQRGIPGLGAGQAGVLSPAVPRDPRRAGRDLREAREITSRQRPRRAGNCGLSPGWKRRTSAACGRWPWPGAATKRCANTRCAAARCRPSWGSNPRRARRSLYADIRDGRLAAPRGSEARRGYARRGEDRPQTTRPCSGQRGLPSEAPAPPGSSRGRMSWAASAAAWMPRWPVRRGWPLSAGTRAAGRRHCSKLSPVRPWPSTLSCWWPLHVAHPAAVMTPSHPCAGSPKCSSATFLAGWAGIRQGRKKWNGWLRPPALPWDASRSTVPTSWTRSFPSPRLPAGRTHLQTMFVDGPPPNGPRHKARCRKAPLSQGVLFDQLLCTLAAIASRAAAAPAPGRSSLGGRCDRGLSPAPRPRTRGKSPAGARCASP